GKVKGDVTGGREAAVSVAKLMAETIAKLPPEDVIASWDEHRGRGRFKAMWKDLGTRTVARMAAGAVRMAGLWQAAWEEGDGDQIKASQIQVIPQDELMDLYNDPSFVPSMSLKKMFDAGLFDSHAPNDSGSSNGDASNGRRRTPSRGGRRRRRVHT